MWIKTKWTKRRKKREIMMSLICLHNRVMQHMKQQRIGTIFYFIVHLQNCYFCNSRRLL